MKLTVYFKRLPNGVLGESEGLFNLSQGRIIRIDLKKNTNHARVFLHELGHIFYTTWSETRIIKWEVKVWRGLTQRERFALYKKMFNRKWRIEKEG